MSNVLSFPAPQEPRTVEVVWRIRAYRRSDWALVERECDSEEDANETARSLYAQGYDVAVRLHFIEHIADWLYDKDWNKDS